MKSYSNLPRTQRRTQQLVEELNGDEQLRRYLKWKRYLRRRLCPHLWAENRKLFELLDLVSVRAEPDCIGVILPS